MIVTDTDSTSSVMKRLVKKSRETLDYLAILTQHKKTKAVYDNASERTYGREYDIDIPKSSL